MKRYKTILREFLSTHVESYRKTCALTQEQMAEKLHITPRAYNNLKRGRFCFSIVPLVFFFLLLDRNELLVLQTELQGGINHGVQNEMPE